MANVTRIAIFIWFLANFSGCIGGVVWIEREGGSPRDKHWVPVCPACQQVVNFESMQCINPDCRILLTWHDKVIYAKELYGEKEFEKLSGQTETSVTTKINTPPGENRTPDSQDNGDKPLQPVTAPSTETPKAPPAVAPNKQAPGTNKDTEEEFEDEKW